MYNILIADDHPLFREAICNVIRSGFPGCSIIETADLESTVQTATDEAPTIPVVIVSAEQDKHIVLQAITYGAVGFITKSTPREKMTAAIEQVLAGHVYLPADIIRSEQPNTRRTPREATISPELLQALTRKQLQVLERMAKGESNKQIAYNLDIAETTVKAHVSAILRKLNVHNRVQAILSIGDIDFSTYLRR